MPSRHLPKFPYGAVYFRKSNPPREDWERDYRTAAEDGMNLFRHWFLWSAIEVAPGIYDWEEYDRQVDLAVVLFPVVDAWGDLDRGPEEPVAEEVHPIFCGGPVVSLPVLPRRVRLPEVDGTIGE